MEDSTEVLLLMDRWWLNEASSYDGELGGFGKKDKEEEDPDCCCCCCC